MKKFVCVLLSCLLIVSMASGAFAVVYGEAGWENAGYSESTAWEIPSAAVLARVRDDINSGKISYAGFYKLTNDIDITEYTDWGPIGNAYKFYIDTYSHWGISYYEGRAFRGNFDGNGHTIKINISKFNKLSQTYILPEGALFGFVERGTIKNLRVSGTVEYVAANASYCLGGICGIINDGTIENCIFDGTVILSSLSDSSIISLCAGGIVGLASDKTILNNCKVGYNSPTSVKATASSSGSVYAGGIAAVFCSGECTNNYVKVNLTGTKKGAIYALNTWESGKVSNNVVVDPSEPYAAPLKISGTLTASGVIKKAYSSALTLSGGTSPYTWKKSGTLPTGLKLSYNSAKTKATLKGTPTKAGTFDFTLKVTDSNGNTASKSFTVTITKPTMSGTVSNGVIKAAYAKKTFKVTGGTAPYTWTKSGTLPNGLKLTYNSAKTQAYLSGTPTKAGDFMFTLKATDTNGASVSKSFTVTITKPTMSGSVSNGTVGTAYTKKTFTVTGGKAPYTWKKSGTLPTGLKLTYNSTKTKAYLSGTPTKAGTFDFTLKATDTNGATVSKSFTVTIKAAAKLKISGTFDNGIIDKDYTGSIKVSGGTSPYTWTKSSGTLPTGLKLKSNSTGTTLKLTGTPSKVGTFTFTLVVKSSNSLSLSKKFTVTIYDDDDDYFDVAAVKSKSSQFDDTTKGFVIPKTELKISSDDILSQGEGKDEDLFEVKAEQPVIFIIGEWIGNNGTTIKVSALSIDVYVDDKLVDDITISDEGVFTLPSEFVCDDFKVQAKANIEGFELETEELFISAVK